MKVFRTLRDYPRYRFYIDGQIWVKSKVKKGEWLPCKQTVAVQRQNIKPYHRLMINVENKKGERHTVKAHRLLCEAWHGKPPKNKQEVRHLDGNSLNNNASNLLWGSRLENQADRIQHGSHNRGERSGCAKLNRKQVLAIRKSKKTSATLAAKYGVSKSSVSNIKNKKRWNWL